MAALVHDRVAAGERPAGHLQADAVPRRGDRRGERPGSGGRSGPEAAAAGQPAARRPAAPEVGQDRWRAPLALVAMVVLMAAGGAVGGAAVDLAGGRPTPGGSPPASPAASGAGAWSLAPLSPVPPLPAGAVHVVQPGETFWSIAAAQGGGADIRDRVAALEEANGGRPLRAGDRLVLPEPE